jgi:predicted TIM-barrel fold metal-dependent hydrolase
VTAPDPGIEREKVMSAANLIDVHHHIVPKSYAKALGKLGVSKGLGVRLPRWDVGKSLGVMDSHGITTAVVSISAPGVYFAEHDGKSSIARDLARQTNEFCAQLMRDHPGRFGAFATLPLPDVDAALEELAYALDELRLNGVVLLSNYDGYYLGDLRFDALFAELDRRRSVVFVHPQTPPGLHCSHLDLPEAMLDVCFDTTRTAFSLIVNGVTRRYPAISFILAHAGGAVPYMAGRVGITAGMLEDLNGAIPAIAEGAGKLYSAVHKTDAMPAQLSYYLRFKHNVLPEGPDHFLSRFYYDTALSASPHCFSSLLTITDSAHILFGTDFIFATEAAVPATIAGVQNYGGFTPEDNAAIAHENAVRLLPTLR